MTAGRNPSRAKWLDSFVPHRLEMLRSPAWQSIPAPLARLLTCIEIEHLSHGGVENGNLHVTFSQLQAAGVSRRNITALIELGEGLGLLQAFRPDGAYIRAMTAYRLTYVPAKGKKAPTDEWRGVTAARAEGILARYKDHDRRTRRPRPKLSVISGGRSS